MSSLVRGGTPRPMRPAAVAPVSCVLAASAPRGTVAFRRRCPRHCCPVASAPRGTAAPVASAPRGTASPASSTPHGIAALSSQSIVAPEKKKILLNGEVVTSYLCRKD